MQKLPVCDCSLVKETWNFRVELMRVKNAALFWELSLIFHGLHLNSELSARSCAPRWASSQRLCPCPQEHGPKAVVSWRDLSSHWAQSHLLQPTRLSEERSLERFLFFNSLSEF